MTSLLDHKARRKIRRACGAAIACLVCAGFPQPCPAEPLYAAAGVKQAPCPAGAVAVEPGASIQAAVEASGPGATFCLKTGVHRLQVVRPLDGQSFVGEPGAVLNGARQVDGFVRRGGLWSAAVDPPLQQRHGECLKSAPGCALPDAVFLNDVMLRPMRTRDGLGRGEYYLDRAAARLYLADDPDRGTVEIATAGFAFKSAASNVSIRNVVVEKYASPAQHGAIDGLDASGWTVEYCELRFNSGAGAAVGSHARVRHSDVHDNGQIGLKANGDAIVIEGNAIRSNNVLGFDPSWEAGGVKLFRSRNVVIRGNEVRGNLGAGLWCDTDCRGIDYLDNFVADNSAIGIFHEISFDATIRGNVLRHNGRADAEWFWGAEIALAGSQDIKVVANHMIVSAGACGVVLIDQNRAMAGGGRYKTRRNIVSGNVMTFEGRPCAGGVSDARSGDDNFGVIENGGNVFDGDVYRAPRSAPPGRFAWGGEVAGWDQWRAHGVEANGALILDARPLP